MRFIIRQERLVLAERDLAVGRHVIGRGPSAELALPREDISRRHGELASDDGERWTYRDLRTAGSVEQPVDRETRIPLAPGLELLRADGLEDAPTYVGARPTMGRSSWAARAALLTVLFLLLGASAALLGPMRPTSRKGLLDIVRPKVLELEHAADPKTLEVFRAYARLEEADMRPERGFCSAFLIAPNVALTAAHCLRGSLGVGEAITRFHAKTHDGVRAMPSRVLGLDLQRDYLFLELTGLEAYGYLELSPRFEIAQPVWTVGNVSGEGIAIRDGIMASTTTDPSHPEIDYLRFSAAASPGNSGGPLLDAEGRVLGLVFASAASENYNLATGAAHLLEGKARFVDDQARTNQKIVILPRRIANDRVARLLRTTGLDIPDTWSQNPEYLRPFDDLTFEVEVPSALPAYSEQLAKNLDATLRKLYREVRERTRLDGRGTGAWRDIPVDAGSMIVLSSPGHSSLVAGLPGAWWPTNIEIVVGPPRDDVIKRWRQERGLRTNYHLGMESAYLPVSESRAVEASDPRVFFHPYDGRKLPFGADPAFAAIRWAIPPPGGWRQARSPDATGAESMLKSREGVLYHTGTFPFVRPSAHRAVSVASFPPALEPAVVTDARGRRWTRFSWDIFGEAVYDAHCIGLPQEVLCRYAFVQTSEPALVEVLRRNMVEFVLSELLIPGLHWRLDALAAFRAEEGFDQLEALSDVDVTLDERGRLVVELETLGLRVRSRQRAQLDWTLRPITALEFPEVGVYRSVAVGFEILSVDERGGDLCVFAAERDAFPWYDQPLMEDLEDAMADNDQPPSTGSSHWVRSAESPRGPLTVYGSCQRLKKVPGRGYLVPSGKKRPYAFAFEPIKTP